VALGAAVLLALAASGCDDKTVNHPPFTAGTPDRTPTATSSQTETPEPTPPPSTTPKPNPIKSWIKGTLTVKVLDRPDPKYPEVPFGYAQVILSCGYAPKSAQSVMTGLNEPGMNKGSKEGEHLNGPTWNATIVAFGSTDYGLPDIYTIDTWPLLIPQEDSLPLPEISTAYQVIRPLLKLDRILKAKAAYTAGCAGDLKPGLPADVEIWADWDWQAGLSK
jgi:hypothetical protein